MAQEHPGAVYTRRPEVQRERSELTESPITGLFLYLDILVNMALDTITFTEVLSPVFYTECDLLLEDGGPLLDEEGNPIAQEVCLLDSGFIVTVQIITLNEFVSVVLLVNSVNDETVTLSENIQTILTIETSVVETIGVLESISNSVQTALEVVDTVVILEDVLFSASTEFFVTVFDSIALFENTANDVKLFSFVFDELILLENLAVDLIIDTFYVSIIDALASEENVNRSVDTVVSTFELITLGEYLENVVFFTLEINEPITVGSIYVGGDKYNIASQGPRRIPTGAMRPISPRQSSVRPSMRGTVDSR